MSAIALLDLSIRPRAPEVRYTQATPDTDQPAPQIESTTTHRTFDHPGAANSTTPPIQLACRQRHPRLRSIASPQTDPKHHVTDKNTTVPISPLEENNDPVILSTITPVAQSTSTLEGVVAMDGDSVRLLETRLFHVERREQRLRDGSSKPREVICHPGAVTIIPMVDESHVCLIRNYRVAVENTLIELPAGTLEPGEKPDQTAIRELQEETGFRTTQLRSLHSFFLSPGILDEQMHLFVATDLEAGPPHRESGELIENHIVSWTTAMDMVHDGTIQDAKTLVGLLLYDQLRS